jgi:hypothetical protein
MATLDSLKQALSRKAKATTSSLRRPLSERQYSDGFDILVQSLEWTKYEDFVVTQLSQLLAPLFNRRTHISALEIRPGPKSLLGQLPGHLRRKVKRYAALEPNGLFATRLEESICSTNEAEAPLPCLKTQPEICRVPFTLQENLGSGTNNGTSNGAIDHDEKYDVILFCHSMYEKESQYRFIKQALEMLVERPVGGMVVVCHRDGALHFDGLVCHQTATCPTGSVRVIDSDEVLDKFSALVAGFTMEDADVDKAIRVGWREVCRALGGRDEAHANHLFFNAPFIMATFTQHATSLPELTAHVPLMRGNMTVNNWEARFHQPASMIRPTEIRHIQRCVQWALKHETSLTVVGGAHSGHCFWPNVVAVDMGAFDQVHIPTAGEDRRDSGPECSFLVVVEAGCKTRDIVRKTTAAGLAIPLGTCPSVGAGSWLQGGTGRLERLHGLACDAIVGAIVVSVDSGQLLCVGRVPSQHQPPGATRPENEADVLWGIKGAGTNFGIVVSITFEASTARAYFTRHCVVPLRDRPEAQLRLSEFDTLVAKKLDRSRSADAYLYWEEGQLQLGVTMFEHCTNGLPSAMPTPLGAFRGLEDGVKVVEGVGLFEMDVCVSGMPGRHGSGKTSSFKRCLFLKDIGEASITGRLVTAVETRPSPLCYVHLEHGGGAVRDTAADGTAFGCRDWDFACIIYGVWPRDQDGTEAAQSAVRWVYSVAGGLLSLSSGAYGADLGPDPRDAPLAATAFGRNGPPLARLKQSLDPRNVLAYTCPLPKAPTVPAVILLVTGESGAGKDYCADVWVAEFRRYTHKRFNARAVSISEACRREYAAATGADPDLLLSDRAYKEQHRPKLTHFFAEQVLRRPRLLEEHFLDVVHSAVHVDVLLITGMRDDAPVANLSHLVPDSRLLDAHVQASERTRQTRRGCHQGSDIKDSNNSRADTAPLEYCPSLIFDNEMDGDESPKRFAQQYLLPFCHDDLQRLAHMVRPVPDFPR